MISLVIPVYKNELNIPPLLSALEDLNRELKNMLEVVFVVDGSPDGSYEALRQLLPASRLKAQLASLSRNFGSFAAIRAGLALGKGSLFAVMAADLQEPPSLVSDFYQILERDEADIVVATRASRADSLRSKTFSKIAWTIFRKFIIRDMPAGGVDVFACNRNFRDQILKLRESNTSLVGLVFWLGYRRKIVYYDRLERKIGKSAWTFTKSLRYFLDSCFSFSDLPIRFLTMSGLLGLLVAVVLGTAVIASKISGQTTPGYAATAILIMFFGSLNCLGLGIIGEYVWRAYENTKMRPESIVASVVSMNE